MTRERSKPQGTTLERIDKDYEKVILQRNKDFRDGYNKAVKEAAEYLENVCYGDYAYDRYHNAVDFDRECFVADFKKFMEDE